MGLFSWLVNPFQATTNMVVENAVTQYGKIKKADTSVEEGDIASVLWTYRYMNANLSDEAERRLARYMLSGFVVRNMVDFCLGTMDIELQVDPNNELHDKAASNIVQGLRKRGVPCRSEDIGEFNNRWFKEFENL